MSVTFIHAADIHLDSAFSGLSATNKSKVRKEDMRTSFARIIDLAKEKDFLFLSGDLFDSASVSKLTLDFLKQQFARLSPVPVFIAAGNHDAFSFGSVYETFDFGENVHVFSTEPECIETEKADIYGVSFESANEERRLLLKFTVKNKNKLNILVLHGNLLGEGYNPIRLSEIAESGMDYIALGHIHAKSDVQKQGNTFYAYPGCSEARGFDETGEKGVLAVSLEKGIAEAAFVPVQERMYLEEAVDVSGKESYEDILKEIETIYRGNRHIYRIRLVGSPQFPIDAAVVREKIDAFDVTVRDETAPQVDIDSLSQDFTLKGLFAKFAKEDKENMDEQAFLLAFKTGLSLIEKEERNEN